MRRARRALVAVLALLLGGCASGRPGPAGERAFDLGRDGFAFANQVVWTQAAFGSGGDGYHHRCFVLARSARQFYLHARFDPAAPPREAAQYRERIREVVARDPRGDLADTHPVVIEGYADLRAFSRDHEALLKQELGSAFQSYFQVGNWRMFYPFTRSHQERVAIQLQRMLRNGRPAVIHAVRFPIMTINHALLVYDVTEHDGVLRFSAYDPNAPDAPLTLRYDRARRTFIYPATGYFWGGPVSVYEIYRRGLF